MSTEKSPGMRPLTVYFNTAVFGDREIAEFLSRLSALYRELGGDSLIIAPIETRADSRQDRRKLAELEARILDLERRNDREDTDRAEQGER